MQFLPVVEKVRYQVNAKGRRVDNARPSIVAPEYGGDGFGSWSVSDIGYGRFLCDIFDVWVKTDVGRDVRRHIGFILRSDSGNVLILRDLRLQCSGRAQWRCLCVRPFRVPGISAGQRILVEPQDNDAVRQGCVIRHRQAQFSSVSMSPLRMGASLQRRMS